MKKISTQYNHHRHLENGFTLLELLLVIGVAAVLFLGITKITTSWVDSEVSTGAGQHLQRISTVVQKYVEANWAQLANTPTDDALNQGGVWTGLKDSLDQEGLLSNGKLVTPLNADLKIGFVTDNPSGSNIIYRATIYATKSLPYKRVLDAARNTGNTGGIISFFPDGTNAFGAFGQWKVPVNKLLPGGAALPCTPADSNACLVAVISYNEQTLCGPFLYRTNVETPGPGEPTCTGGNSMTTDLKMNANNIVGAANIAADDLTVNNAANLGSTTIAGTTTLNGPVTASNGMNITGGGMTVSGDANFSNNVNMNGGGTLSTTKLNALTVQAANIQTNDLQAQDMTTSGTLAVDNGVTVGGSVDVSGAGASIFASAINTGDINASSGSVNVGTMNVNNTMQINGQLNVTGNTIATDKLVAGHCVKIANASSPGGYDQYGTCP